MSHADIECVPFDGAHCGGSFKIPIDPMRSKPSTHRVTRRPECWISNSRSRTLGRLPLARYTARGALSLHASESRDRVVFLYRPRHSPTFLHDLIRMNESLELIAVTSTEVWAAPGSGS